FMDRKEFILATGKLAALTVAVSCFGCSSSSDSNNPTAPPSNVDFTIDLSSQEGQALESAGGSVYKNGIVIARISQTEFTALSQVCTHQGTTVQYQSGAARFHCPNHGSNFDLNGGVINGPAASPLKKYTTTLNGNILRVTG
ncbi:MAG: ubiquinol-cytochrome c reductase iron-sulfur subunit, partial [Syntrophothermus sp.]